MESRAVGVGVMSEVVNGTPRDDDKATTHLSQTNDEPSSSKILSSLQGLLTLYVESTVSNPEFSLHCSK